MPRTQVTGKNIKDGSILAVDIDPSFPPAEKVKSTLLLDVCYSGDIASGTFFKRKPGDVSCGSTSGYFAGGVAPFHVPFSCILSKVYLSISGATYDNRVLAGPLYAQLAAYAHTYNSCSRIFEILIDIPGSYTGTSFNNIEVKPIIDAWSLISGNITIPANSIIGMQFRKDKTTQGQCSKLKNSFITLEFTEI